MRKFLIPVLILAGLFFLGIYAHEPKRKETQPMTAKHTASPTDAKIYFAGGCFWGMERLFQSIEGVTDTECGYANGKPEIVPDYKKVCAGDTGYRETVRVTYDPQKVTLEQLLTAFFYVIDPTTEKRQGPDIGDQYQTGIYYTDDAAQKRIDSFVAQEKQKYSKFVVEIAPLERYYAAEDYHQDYLIQNPQGYCHIPQHSFEEIDAVVRAAAPTASYHKPDSETLLRKLTPLQYDVTQKGATEHPFTGAYWNFDQKGIYVDITTGEPLFSSLDKFPSSCGWPSFSAAIEEKHIKLQEDHSHGMERIEVKSNAGDAHLGHVFYGEPESPNGVRYCINSAALAFIPYEDMKEKGYEAWLSLFDTP